MRLPATKDWQPGRKTSPLSVGDLVGVSAKLLETSLGSVWIEGEVASITKASSGHIYMVLKDKKSQLRAVMWRSDAQSLGFSIEIGMSLLCRGQVGIYQRDAKFQFYVKVAEPSGLGAEAAALAQLRDKLAKEGLFALETKRPLPFLPSSIGVVTSAKGAALQDIITTIHRRFPRPIVVADATVQGPSAPTDIVSALQKLQNTNVDVIIVGRGGGAKTDLSAFNDEKVVRAIAQSKIPTISAIGHEIDTTLSDLAADHRAVTPTGAGELVVPLRQDLQEQLKKVASRLQREMSLFIQQTRQHLDSQSLELSALLHNRLHTSRRSLSAVAAKIETLRPDTILAKRRVQISRLQSKIDSLFISQYETKRKTFQLLTARLEALSPLRVLQRGYAVVAKDKKVIDSIKKIHTGDNIVLRLKNGTAQATITQIEELSS